MSLFSSLGVPVTVSGRRCRQHVAQLSTMHRIMGSPGYRQALAYVKTYVKEQLAQPGVADVADVTVERFPMDGARAYGDWIPPAAWSPRAAELWVEHPERVCLGSYADTPVCLHVGSQSTPAEGIAGELIDVGNGTSAEDYAGRDVAGRIVLAAGTAGLVYEEAVRRRGARGIVTDAMPWSFPAAGRTPLDMPDLVSYDRLPVRKEEIGSGVFSFAISHRQGRRLRRWLQQGPVRVRATVDATPHPGHLEVLNVHLPGTGEAEAELVLIAHLCHPQPGANDNASGPALMMDLVRALVEAQQRGDLAPLRHDLRLLFVPEVYGTVSWLQESETARQPMQMVLNLDMVGGDGAQNGGQVWLDRTPWSHPTYLNDLIPAVMEEVTRAAPDGWRTGVRDHMGGSDHVLFLAPEIGAPALMLGQFPDRFYHSDQDTVDRMSPREFEKVGQVVLNTLLAVDRIDARRAGLLAHLVYEKAVQRLVEHGQRIVRQVKAGHRTMGDYATSMQVLLTKEQSALRSIVDDTCDADREVVRSDVERLVDRVADVCAAQLDLMSEVLGPARDPISTGRDEQVPRRLFQGPISTHLFGISRFQEALGPGAEAYRERVGQDFNFVRWLFECSYLMDGRHTLGQIGEVLAAEFGDEVASVADLHRFVDDLVAVDMVTLEP